MTRNKSQIFEQLYTLPTFQNGRDTFNKGCSPRTSPWLLIKIDLNDAYFVIPLEKSSGKYIRLQWERNL